MTLLALIMTATIIAATTAPGVVAQDRSGSRDPEGIERYPRAEIVEYRREAEARPRSFVMGRVDSIRRELRVQDQLEVPATLESATYLIPEGIATEQVVEHYHQRLGGELLFRCSGRDCGRSNDWANQIFNIATLYGPDARQHYRAVERDGDLVSLYVVERGNRRVYAHLTVLTPDPDWNDDPNALLTRRLAERGWAVIEAVQPDPEGNFDSAATAVLGDLVDALAQFADQEVYLVCHLQGAAGTAALQSASQRCAERGAEVIGAAGADAAESGLPELRPYGAGPLLPRPPHAASRLELILPELLRRDHSG